MSGKREYILTIGGFDPSGGAGVLADIKTFEQHRLIGMAVITANTVQTEDRFDSVNWIDEAFILKQLDFLLDQYTFRYIKIGLVPSLSLIPKIHERIAKSGSKLVWDPVLKASAGFDMKHDQTLVVEALQCVEFVTPNWNEVQWLADNSNSLEAAQKISQFCQVYLKGGHNETDPGRDFVYWNNSVYPLRSRAKKGWEKHGSGCVLSSALAANLTRGFPVLKSCLLSKEYISGVLDSNNTLLGSHKK